MHSKLSSYIDRSKTLDYSKYNNLADKEVDNSVAYNPYVIAPDSRVYGQLGNIVFIVSDGISRFSEQAGYDYAQASIVSGTNALQSIGKQLSKIQILISFYDFLSNNIEASITMLSQTMYTGQAQPFLFGKSSDSTYVYKGKYVIESINTSVVSTAPSGKIKIAHLKLSLLEYVDRSVVEIKHVESKKTNPQNRIKVGSKRTIANPASISEDHKKEYEKTFRQSIELKQYWNTL